MSPTYQPYTRPFNRNAMTSNEQVFDEGLDGDDFCMAAMDEVKKNLDTTQGFYTKLGNKRIHTEDTKTAVKLKKVRLQAVTNLEFIEIQSTQNQALDILFEVEDEHRSRAEDIFIEPPAVNILTDEDSGDEDGGGTIDNLAGRQLQVPVELRLENNIRIGGTSRSSKKSATSSNFSTSVDKFIVENEKWVENRIKPVPLWIDGDFDDRVSEFPNPNYGHLFNMTSLELFELFFTNYIIDLLIEETKKYSSFKNCLDQNITSDEIKCFIGILILSGYNQLPSKRNYWEQEQDVQNILVSNSMRGDKFFQIMKFIHCADNNEIKIDDKTWKLRNLMKKIQTRCIENFVPVQNINYDESMIKYFGRHSCKQFIQGKPIRFGYKMWCLNSSDGYLINFDIYQGKLPGGKTTYENVFGKCTAPLIYFLENLSPEKRKLSYRIFCDNLFTSANLLSFLRDRGYSGTGTVRENRLGKDFPLMGKKLFLKKQRGECASTIEKNDCIIYARWMDNSVVTAASTSIGIKPISYVQRYFQKEKKKISVPRPLMIGEYNKYMGGTDLMDQNISTYRIGIRGKKWWWPIFTWLIDMCINNAWILQKKVKPNISQLQFRREIVRMLLTKYGTAPKVEGRPSTSISSLSCNRVSDDVRYDGKEHLVIPTPQKKRRRCAGERCSSSGRTKCCKCNVGLCVECFKLFHTKTY
ncbi:hypothetical protein QTP88_009375 [Uroleucon formosanum]